MSKEDIDNALRLIWSMGYEVKITSKDIRVFNSEYCELLDLDTYNSIVIISHGGNVLSSLEEALTKAIGLLEKL